MSNWSPACKNCTLSGSECLLQGNNDVEDCEDVRKYELEKINDNIYNILIDKYEFNDTEFESLNNYISDNLTESDLDTDSDSD